MIVLSSTPAKDQAMSGPDSFFAEGLSEPDDVSNRLAAHQNDPIVQRALEIIWKQSPFPASVNDIARQLPVTRRTLDRRFVEATGHSVLEEINFCRLSRAKRLLTETDLPVKTVAHLAGFSSTERMRVLFVEREGVSPISYRKRETGPAPTPDEESQTGQFLLPGDI
jgi:transcriptional regulator GlxA family with amidase domain